MIVQYAGSPKKFIGNALVVAHVGITSRRRCECQGIAAGVRRRDAQRNIKPRINSRTRCKEKALKVFLRLYKAIGALGALAEALLNYHERRANAKSLIAPLRNVLEVLLDLDGQYEIDFQQFPDWSHRDETELVLILVTVLEVALSGWDEDDQQRREVYAAWLGLVRMHTSLDAVLAEA